MLGFLSCVQAFDKCYSFLWLLFPGRSATITCESLVVLVSGRLLSDLPCFIFLLCSCLTCSLDCGKRRGRGVYVELASCLLGLCLSMLMLACASPYLGLLKLKNFVHVKFSGWPGNPSRRANIWQLHRILLLTVQATASSRVLMRSLMRLCL